MNPAFGENLRKLYQNWAGATVKSRTDLDDQLKLHDLDRKYCLQGKLTKGLKPTLKYVVIAKLSIIYNTK